VGFFRPFLHPRENNLEIFNELSVLSVGIICFGFGPLIETGKVRYQLGWVVVAIVLLNFIVSTIVIVRECYVDVKKFCKRYRTRKVRKQQGFH